MSRGRPRAPDPTVPKHIDPRRLPKGAYWDRSSKTWYTIIYAPKAKRRQLADATATLADLHRAIEDLDGVPRGTLAWLFAEFHGNGIDLTTASTEFLGLAESTRGAYELLRRTIETRKTKVGALGSLRLSGFTRQGIQALIEAIAKEGTPSKANHVLAYLRRVFRWGMNHGKTPARWTVNPADGVKGAKTRDTFKMPTPQAMEAVIAYARTGAARKAHTKGSQAPYLWCTMEIAYRCRLRGIEVVTLTDAHATPAGIATNRRKGSRDNVVRWIPSLRTAWDTLVEIRAKAIKRHRIPVPMRAEDRVLVVSQLGTPLSKSGLDTAWQRLITRAIEDGAITEEQRFSMHGLKHRGITDTKGNRADKQTASGHKVQQTLDIYDHELPLTDAAGAGD